MVQASGVHVPRSEAEPTRRRLREAGALRLDLEVLRTDDGIVFPVEDGTEGAEPFDFTPRDVRPRSYWDLLDWPEADRALAPRAFEHLGDIALVKVPPPLWDRRAEIGAALVAFLPSVRAAFHDHGVKGEFRTRDLDLLAGDDDAETTVAENGFRLRVDVSKAYFSPRLADERGRLVDLVRPGQRVIDLFGGVAPFAVQAAAKGADVVCVDLNPDACRLAERNAADNKVSVLVRCGDARVIGPTLAPADHVVMNLPHGAKHFLDVAVPLVRPGGLLHYHEILPDADLDVRQAALLAEVSGLGRSARITTVRHVRNYSAEESHYAIDLELE